ncbi:hypothetical protein [Microbacterium sp. 18062]|uniref:hypothetical protein n=1 Tax=Microbacterium sp. 18062 TaxID=2681410 RepID=UPI001F48D644|nr:hypothetical protein [Microbacterium sp. 18062]
MHREEPALADSTKLGRRLFAQVVPLEGADYLITDEPPTPSSPPRWRPPGSPCSFRDRVCT